MRANPKITVLTRSIHWKSILQTALRREFPSLKIGWALDIEDFLSEVAGKANGIGIVELNEATAVNDLPRIAQALNDGNDLRVFAVANVTLSQWRVALRECGFIDVCESVTELPQLIRLIRNCFRAEPADDASIEERVAAQLPWG